MIDQQLTGDEIFSLRALAKVCLAVVKWQVESGLWSDGSGKPYQSKVSNKDGTREEDDDDDTEMEMDIEVDEAQEEMRQNCWMIFEAVVSGWAQRDLRMDAESSFAKMMA